MWDVAIQDLELFSPPHAPCSNPNPATLNPKLSLPEATTPTTSSNLHSPPVSWRLVRNGRHKAYEAHRCTDDTPKRAVSVNLQDSQVPGAVPLKDCRPDYGDSL